MDEQVDILNPGGEKPEDYKETDVFAWASNLVRLKDELKVDVFLFNKNYVLYKTKLAKEITNSLEALFIDSILEYVLNGAAMGLVVRNFEDAEAEENVLQRTWLGNVPQAREVISWIKTQEHATELFKEKEHDLKRMKGVVARVTHSELKEPFYVIKQLPSAQIMKGIGAWMVVDDHMEALNEVACLRIPTDDHLLVLDQDMYVFNQAKLKSLFGYDAKEASIAAQKVAEIEEHFRLSFPEGMTLQSVIKGKKNIIKKLQTLEIGEVKQDELVDHTERMGVGLMTDDDDAIIIMDSKDLEKFVNSLNDDYVESLLTGQRYEIRNKRVLKPSEDDELVV